MSGGGRRVCEPDLNSNPVDVVGAALRRPCRTPRSSYNNLNNNNNILSFRNALRVSDFYTVTGS